MPSFNKYINRYYSNSSFITGLGSVFNIYGNYYKSGNAQFSSKTDQEALKSDWDCTGEDIFNAVKRHSKKLKNYVIHRRENKQNRRIFCK